MKPHVIVNVAMSADGKLSTHERRQVRISGKEDRERVEILKASCDAIMVGIGTVLSDDPSLTLKTEECRTRRRSLGLDENPLRIVVDSTAKIPPSSALLTRGPGQRIVAVSQRAREDKLSELRSLAQVIVIGEEEVNLVLLLEKLWDQGMRRVMVEGGGTLISGLIRAGLVDEIYTYIGNFLIGGRDAPTLVDGLGFVHESEFPSLTLSEARSVDSGILLHWKFIR